MPAHHGRSLLLTCGLLALVSCAHPRAAHQVPANAKLVTVKVKCNDNKLDVSVKPFSVEIKQAESVFWAPETSGNNDVAVAIEPKDPANWPFAAVPKPMPPNGGVSSGPPQQVAQKTTVQYNLRFTCTIDGVQRTIVIDPDIIVLPT